MNLRHYLDSSRRGAAARLARALGVKPVMVSQWAEGVKPVPVVRAPTIEAATDRLVRRWDLRPDDWHVHWPELVGAEGAPPVARAAAFTESPQSLSFGMHATPPGA